MPPSAKLPDAVVADFEAWVTMGAPDPRDGNAATAPRAGTSLDDGRKFWSLVPPTKPAPPAVKAARWPLTDADRFVLRSSRRRG